MPMLDQGFLIRALRSVQRTARPPALVFCARASGVLPSLSGCNAMSSPQEAGMELAVKIDTQELRLESPAVLLDKVREALRACG